MMDDDFNTGAHEFPGHREMRLINAGAKKKGVMMDEKEVYVKVICTYKLKGESVKASLAALRHEMETKIDMVQGWGPSGSYGYSFVRCEDIDIKAPRTQEQVE